MNLPDNYRGGELANQPNMVPGFQGAAPPATDRIDIQALLSILRRRTMMILNIILMSVTIAFLLTIQMPNRFTAIAQVVMKDQNQQFTPRTQDQAAPATPTTDSVDTQVRILQSRDLAGKVVDQLKLGADQDFVDALTPGAGLTSRVKTMLGFAAPLAPPTPRSDYRGWREIAIDALQKNIDVERLGTASAMSIAYTDTNAARAARIVNGIATIYSGSQIVSKQSDNNAAIAILQSRMNSLRAQAQADFGAVQDYRVRNNLLSTNATGLTEQEVSGYNQQVAIARSQAAEDQARLLAARQQLASGTGGVGEAQTSAVVQSLRSQRAAVSARVTDLAGRYLDTHPDLISARAQLADLDAQIDAEVRRTISSLTAKAQSSAERLASLAGSLGSARSALARNNGALVTLDDLNRRAQASQALYESYLNRYKEAVAQSGAEQSDSRLLSSARVPTSPSSPNVVLNLLLGLLVGILLGLVSAFISEASYAAFTTGQEIEQRLGVRYLGGIPLITSILPRAHDALQTIADYPAATFAESMRSVLTSIRQSANSRNQVVALTSALPGDGKSTIAACLARAVALGGERVVVIDCDQHRARLSKMFSIETGRPGLREVLQSNVPFADALIKDPLSEARILPIITPFDKTDRLMDKGSLHRLIAKLREEFDLIILDAAPILPIAEVRDLVTLADNVVVVVRWRKTKDTAVRSALKLLPLRTIDDIGIILNAVDMRKHARFGQGDAASFYPQYKEYYTAN